VFLEEAVEYSNAHVTGIAAECVLHVPCRAFDDVHLATDF
jgi:hypothetical protein